MNNSGIRPDGPGELVEDAHTTSYFRERFDEVWRAAVDGEGTPNFIQHRINISTP